jgi:PTH1 family peptidyl-tRNA hydrolase
MDEWWMIVGLGNPGTGYSETRHNIGFIVVDGLCEETEGLDWRQQSKFSANVAKGTLGKKPVLLVKPQTYMNLSGQAVAALSRFYRVPSERILVVHDEVDLELGRLQLKLGGGDAGHNGLRSITEALGGGDYNRIRFGIGRPVHGDVADYVLHPFARDEWPVVDETIDRAIQAVRAVVGQGLKQAMDRYNNRGPKKRAASEESGPERNTQDKES